MANEVTITVRGSDRTGNLFSGIKARVGRFGADIRSSMGSAGEAAGVQFGDALTRGVDGRLRDAKGRFAKAIIPGTDLDTHGRSIGSKLVSGVLGGLQSAAGAVTGALGKTLSAASSAAGPVPIAGLAVVGAAAGTALAAAIGGALMLGLGAGFVGIGAMVLMENEKIKAEFAKTGTEIKQIMADASKPLLPVFRDAFDQVKALVKDFKPVFTDVFKDAQGPLKDFIREFIGAFKELKPAVAPIMSAFTGLLDVIGPSLKGIFKDIAGSLQDLARVVIENKSLIGGIFTGLIAAIPKVISGLTWVVERFSDLAGAVNASAPVMAGIFNGITQSVLSFAETFLGTLRSIGVALGNVPGMEEFSRKMVSGLDAAISKVGEWKAKSAELNREIQLKANINDLTMKLDRAKSALSDPNITKERRATLAADITKLETAKAKAVADLGDPRLVKEYKSKLNTDIGTLQSRIATAKKELASPDLTRERKAKLNADIAALKAQVAAAKAALASIQNRTVYVNTVYRSSGGVRAEARAHGGVVGGGLGVRRFANGGVSGSGTSLAMVGEQGPELVRLPFGSSVVPAGQTRNALGQGGGGVVVNLYVQGSIRSDRDLIQIIRDEFTRGGFRGAVATS